jgi:hypothetical protein
LVGNAPNPDILLFFKLDSCIAVVEHEEKGRPSSKREVGAAEVREHGDPVRGQIGGATFFAVNYAKSLEDRCTEAAQICSAAQWHKASIPAAASVRKFALENESHRQLDLAGGSHVYVLAHRRIQQSVVRPGRRGGERLAWL